MKSNTNNLHRVIGVLATCMLLMAGAAQAAKAPKVDICHLDAEEGIFQPITVNGNAVAKHVENHGDQFPNVDPGDGRLTLDEDCLGIEPPPAEDAVVIVDNTSSNAFFGYYQTRKLTQPGWDLLQSTIDWVAPGASTVVLFTYNGTLNPADLREASGLATYNYLNSQGYAVTVHHQSAIEIGDFSAYDLAIYNNTFPRDVTNLLAQNVSFITVSPGQTDEMGIGTGALTGHIGTDTTYVIDNTHPITSAYPLGPLTFASSLFIDSTQALGDSTVLVVLEDPAP
jgi:hypothetical protein